MARSDAAEHSKVYFLMSPNPHRFDTPVRQYPMIQPGLLRIHSLASDLQTDRFRDIMQFLRLCLWDPSDRFKLSDVKVTNARRVAVDDSALAKMKGKLVVLNDGKEPLSAAYLGLFQEDAIVISLVAEKK